MLKQQIIDLVRSINEAWLDGRYDELSGWFAEDMILAMPGFRERVTGRDAIVTSYRNFGASARVVAFEPAPPAVDLIGNMAITTTAFRIRYELGGETHDEEGTDLLVFSFRQEAWKVVWRTLLVGVP